MRRITTVTALSVAGVLLAAGTAAALNAQVLRGPSQSSVGTADTLLISFGPEAGSKAKRRREQAEAAAGRFKVLSDPTRVAILSRVLQMPTSITDLALYFDLSQPTVSVHMKMLREAGLLESTRSGAQTLYTASPEHVRDFVRQAGEIVTDEDLIGC